MNLMSNTAASYPKGAVLLIRFMYQQTQLWASTESSREKLIQGSREEIWWAEFVPDCTEVSLHDVTYQEIYLSTSPSVKSWSLQLSILLYSSFLSKTLPLDPHRLLAIFCVFMFVSFRSICICRRNRGNCWHKNQRVWSHIGYIRQLSWHHSHAKSYNISRIAVATPIYTPIYRVLLCKQCCHAPPDRLTVYYGWESGSVWYLLEKS